MAKTKEENPVYVRLSYPEAIQSKRDILSLQMSLLKMIKLIRNYKLLRLEELRYKAKTYRRINELTLNIRKIKTELPKIKVPQINKKEDEFKERVSAVKTSQPDDGLESQLREIQEKLRAIGG